MEKEYKELLENLLHELPNIITNLKASAETISKISRGNFDRNAMIHHAEAVLENVFQISIHLDITNYSLNPEYIFEVEKYEKRNIFGKFHKAILSYKRRLKDKGLTINQYGEIKTLIDSKPVIDTLPLLLLDNAIKYSPSNSDIEIEFDESPKFAEIRVTNIGPYVSIDERPLIFERGFRGMEAKKTELPGHGYGLNLVEFIADIHNAKISTFFSEDISTINGINYSEFTIEIQFPKQIYL